MRIGNVVGLIAVFLAAGVSCKKKQGAGEGTEAAAPATAEHWSADGAAAPAGDLEGERGGGTLAAGTAAPAAKHGETVQGAVSPTAGGQGAAAASATVPAASAAGGTPETPRTLTCSRSEMAWDPTEPDPEAGSFTLDEALAGLPGSGPPVATIETSLGTVRCTLEGDRVPNGVANFVGLARGVRPWWDPCRKAWVKEPFYDGLTFHRVIPGFMAQGGDLFGNGMGGPGYTFPSEIVPDLLHDRSGTLAYANSGPDTNGSQFYITVGRRSQLDGGYVVFGYCDVGDVIQRIVSVPRDGNDKPYQPVLIRKVTIAREG